MLIELTKGYSTEIDDDDQDLVDINWYASMDTSTKKRNKIYATTRPCNKIVRLHRLILERMLGRSLKKGEECDHIDCNTLNNKRSNLRLATRAQNGRNKMKQSSRSNFKGIYFDNFAGKWKAQITIDNKNYNLGRYASEIEAAKVYDRAAKTYFGEFARTNGLDTAGVVLPELRRPKKSKSGFVGVYQSRNRWQAEINHNGKAMHIGSYKTPEDAHLAYEAKANELRHRE